MVSTSFMKILLRLVNLCSFNAIEFYYIILRISFRFRLEKNRGLSILLDAFAKPSGCSPKHTVYTEGKFISILLKSENFSEYYKVGSKRPNILCKPITLPVVVLHNGLEDPLLGYSFPLWVFVPRKERTGVSSVKCLYIIFSAFWNEDNLR